MKKENRMTQTSKNWSHLYIMHKDRRVATIYRTGKCTIYYSSFMPYNLYLEAEDDLDTRLNNLNNFYYWCSSRLLTLDRKYAKEILNSIGAMQAITDKDRADIAISYHCLSLTDVYWIKLFREDLDFDRISLYRHSLSNAFADVSLRGVLTVQNADLIDDRDVAGDIGTQGVAPKAWIRGEDGFYLYKDGDPRDVEAELLASRIVDCFDISHVSYTRDTFSGVTVSKCRIVTSEDVGIVPFEHVSIYCENHNRDPLDFVLRRDPYDYYMMNIIDYLIGNTDRHWGNWGFSVDNATNKLKQLYPLMDFNKSFLSYNTTDGAKCLARGTGFSQKDAALEAVKKVGLNRISEIDPGWFSDSAARQMFFTRLNLLEEAAGDTPTILSLSSDLSVTSSFGATLVTEHEYDNSETGFTVTYDTSEGMLSE